MAVRCEGDLIVGGKIFDVTSLAYPAGEITNTHIHATAAIAASKLQWPIPLRGELNGTVADGTTKRRLRWVKGTAGTLHAAFTISCQTPPSGGSTATVDLQVDGVTVLTAVITLNSSTVANTELTAVVSSNSVADGERIDVVIVGSENGTDAMPADIDFQVDLDETYQA
jgi:hypothetical protein